MVSKEMFTAISGENLVAGWKREGPEGEEPPVLAPEGTAGVVRAVVQHDLVQGGPRRAHVRRPDVPRRASAEGRQRQFNQVGGSAWVPRSLRSMPRPSSCSCELREGGHPARFHAPSVELHGLRRSSAVRLTASRLPVHDEHADELCDTCTTRAEVNPLRAFDCKNPQCRGLWRLTRRRSPTTCATSAASTRCGEGSARWRRGCLRGGLQARARPDY